MTRNRSGRLDLALAVLPMGLVLLYLGSISSHFDFQIYHGALTDVLHGGSAYDFMLYEPHIDETMGFIYPPFASLVMLPLAMVSESLGATVMSVVTTILVMAALLGCFGVIDARIRAAGRGQLPRILAILAPLPMAFSSAAASNMTLGQVSFAVGALVLLDVTLLPQRWRGTLVGLVGAVKLTPMILVPYYLVTRQWRAAINASIAFGAATLLSAAFRWSDSIRYWFHPDVVSTSLGDLARSDNWSIYGVVSRMGLDGTTRTLAWLALAATVLGLAVWRAMRHHRAGQELEAVLVMGLVAGLVTLATWPHHVLFCLVAGALLSVQRPLVGFPLTIALTLAGYIFRDQVGDWVVLLMTLFVVVGLPKPPRPATVPTGVPDLVVEPVPGPA